MPLAYKGAEFSPENLFEEIKETVARERINSIIQYKDLIDEIVEEKRIYGFFSDDEDLAQIKKNLELRWPEVKKFVNKREEADLP